VAWAWCLWPLCQLFRSPPSSNNLKAGFPLDLDLEDPTGSSSFPRLYKARSSTSPLAGRGGEGMESGSGPAFLVGARLEEPEVVVPPRYVISPARGLVLFAYLVPAVRASAAASCVSPPDGSRSSPCRPSSPASSYPWKVWRV
jgi:hypothetical protein